MTHLLRKQCLSAQTAPKFLQLTEGFDNSKSGASSSHEQVLAEKGPAFPTRRTAVEDELGMKKQVRPANVCHVVLKQESLQMVIQGQVVPPEPTP